MTEMLTNYYQIPANYQPPPAIQEYVTLVDSDGDILTDADTGEQLFAIGSPLTYPTATALPFVLTNDRKNPIRIRSAGKQRSEVAVSLLGMPRESESQLQYAIVNTYAADPKEFDQSLSYTYFLEPSFYWNLEQSNAETGLVGCVARHLPDQKCIQAYAFPPKTSYPWAQIGDAPLGYFPGGRSDGIMRASFESVRVIRYQPGKICRVTLGIKTNGSKGGIQRWGVRNRDGDSYFFQLENGTDFYLVRTTPGKPDIKTARSEWNGDPLDGTKDLWVLRPDKVTMFQIEYGWYGAIGAKFMALVPFGAGPNSGARWIRLHSMDWLDSNSAGDPEATLDLTFATPSLRNPYMRLFVETEARSGVDTPQSINLYGSSAYIDGGDAGNRTPGRGVCENKTIDTHLRGILGLQSAAVINNIPNQRIVIPSKLTAVSTVDAVLQICMQRQRRAGFNPRDPIDLGYGLARRVDSTISTLTNLPAATLSPSRDRLLGNFASVTLASPNTFPMQLKLEGVGLNNVYVTNKIGNAELVLNRTIPAGTALPATIQMNPFAARAISVQSIPTGVTTGSIYCERALVGNELVRVGLWPSNGRPTSSYSAAETAWGMVTNTFIAYGLDVNDAVIETGTGVIGSPFRCAADWRIELGQLIFETASVPMLGYPLFLVAEFRQGGSLIDAVFDYRQGVTRTTLAVTWQNLVNATVVEPTGGAYATVQFNPPSELFSGALVDVQGTQVLASPTVLQTHFLAANTPTEIDLTNTFEVTKQFLSQSSVGQLDAFFVAARATSGTGLISAYLGWEEI